MRKGCIPCCFTMLLQSHKWLRSMARRAGHNNMSQLLEELIVKEYERQKAARARKEEVA